MKLLILIAAVFLLSFVDCANLVKRQSNLNDIQSLLQELEKANANTVSNANKESNTPVRDALGRLFGAFQEMTKAYVGLLTSVGKSVGVPLPTIGKNAQFYSDQSLILQQINENMKQLQSSISKVTNSLTDLINRPVADSNVVVGEASKFVRLWGNQLQDMLKQFNQAISNSG